MLGTRSSFFAWRAVVVAAAVALLLMDHQAADAGGGTSIGLPLTTKNPSGLSLRIHSRGIDANGYRPVQVRVFPTTGKPFNFDRQLRIVLGFSKYGAQGVEKISQIVELPEGSAGVTATMLVPQSGSFQSVMVETYEGGEKQRDLSHESFGWPVLTGWSWTEARPAVMFIDSNVPLADQRDSAIQVLQSTGADPSPTFLLPDVRRLMELFPDVSNNTAVPAAVPGRASPPANAIQSPQISDTTLLSLINVRSRTEMISPAELPMRWIELSQYDVAVIAVDDLQRMTKYQKPQLAALRDWLSTGPALIVYGVGSSYSNLKDLESLLGLPALTPDDNEPDLRGWTVPDSLMNKGGLQTSYDDAGVAVPAPGRKVLMATKSKKKSLDHRSDERLDTAGDAKKSVQRPFVFRGAQLGCVVAIASNKPFPGTRKDWSWIFNSVEDHTQWFRRTGFSLSRTNDDYWKFLIPGVGEAPIWSFTLLVSLFAVVIGPLNYWFLGRSGRLYLLLITVPAGAALVTISLFTFAIVSDGLGTRLRIRSYADLDQRTGQAAVWSWQSYYAGIAPSQGLVFPPDSTVFELEYEPGTIGEYRQTLMVWDGDQQLRRGFLSSRTAAQYMVCRATTSKAALAVKEGPAAGQSPTIDNRLATQIHYLLLRDSRGDYFAGQDLRDKAKKQLEPVELAAAREAMEELARPVQPAERHGYDPSAHNNNLFFSLGIRRSRMPNSDGGAGDPEIAKGLLEINITAAIHAADEPPSPGTYIAIVERSPLVVTGVSRGREEASFHVIRGRY